jgi:IS5 family transposase
MLRDAYAFDKRFAEILEQFPEMDAELRVMDACLADEQIFQAVRADLAKRWPQTLVNGRYSTPVEVGLRMLVVKRMYDWSYAETEYHVRDSLILRQFCRIYLQRVPDDTTLIRWNQVIRPETLEQFNQRVTQIAVERKVTKGVKLRTDGTVVLTNIHAPADNQLLADGMRVLSRTVQRGRERLAKLGAAVSEPFVDATREAVQLSRQIGEVLRKHTETTYQKGRELYRELITHTQQVMQTSQQTLAQLRAQAGDRAARRLAQTFDTFLPRVAQVIQQTERRIFQQEKVPASEKIVSLFEPHSDILVNAHKTPNVEFGHKVWLNEVDGGIVSHYRILAGNPADTGQWLPSLAAHTATFGHPPEQASADRGLFSADNETKAKDQGIERVILPKNGGRSKKRIAYEHEDWFVEGRHWHAGVEGRISLLKRRFGLECCLAHGRPGFERWVGWGVIAHNLVSIGRAATRKEKNK